MSWPEIPSPLPSNITGLTPLTRIPSQPPSSEPTQASALSDLETFKKAVDEIDDYSTLLQLMQETESQLADITQTIASPELPESRIPKNLAKIHSELSSQLTILQGKIEHLKPEPLVGRIKYSLTPKTKLVSGKLMEALKSQERQIDMWEHWRIEELIREKKEGPQSDETIKKYEKQLKNLEKKIEIQNRIETNKILISNEYNEIANLGEKFDKNKILAENQVLEEEIKALDKEIKEFQAQERKEFQAKPMGAATATAGINAPSNAEFKELVERQKDWSLRKVYDNPKLFSAMVISATPRHQQKPLKFIDSFILLDSYSKAAKKKYCQSIFNDFIKKTTAEQPGGKYELNIHGPDMEKIRQNMLALLKAEEKDFDVEAFKTELEKVENLLNASDMWKIDIIKNFIDEVNAKTK